MKLIYRFLLLPLCLINIQNSLNAAVSDYAGPFLNFLDPGKENDQWNLSALIVAPDSTPVDSLGLTVPGMPELHPTLIDTINNQKFWHYPLSFQRNKAPQTVTYSIGEGGAFSITIPEAKSDPHVFFGSCNQYGQETSMWEKINEKHTANPFHLGILGGDQIYMDANGQDGGGVFDLESIKAIMLADEETKMAPLSDEQKVQVDEDLTNFMLNYYIEHYSKPGFKEFLATVPCKSLDGDHEFFNGIGSYDTTPPVLRNIAAMANRFYFLFQHHTTKETASKAGLLGPLSDPSLDSSLMSYSYLLQFETIAFYGLDTRTERTVDQITSAESREFMLDQLRAALQKNVVIVVEGPPVYQDLNFFANFLGCISNYSCLKKLYQNISGFPDSERTLDIRTDFVDGWSYESHVDELKELIQNLVKEIAKPKGRKVIILAGDVHSAGAAEIVDEETGETAVWELISSPITTAPLPSSMVWIKWFASCFQSQQNYGDSLVGKITGYEKESDGTKSEEIALNNWLELSVVNGEVSPSLWTLPSESEALEKWVPQGW